MSQADTNPMLAAALYHAMRGRPVFPCGENKRPLIATGFKAASTQSNEVHRWWSQWPDALIGMPTGPPSRVWVLDVDVHHGAQGEDSLHALIKEHGSLPDTVEAMTASGGRHLYFRWDPGRPVRNSAGKLGPGLDVRGAGGYVIVPPSRLPDGRAYEWEGSSDPDEGIRPAKAPEWLLDLVAPREEKASPPRRSTPNRFVSRAEVESALGALDPDCSYDDWLCVGMALQSADQPWGFEVFDAWSATGAKYAGAEAMRKKWDSFSSDGNASGTIAVGSLFALAKAAGWVRPVRRTEGFLPPAPPDDLPTSPPSGPPGDPPGDGDGGDDDEDGAPVPVIQIVSGELPHIVDQAEAALLRAGAPIYVHGNRLVRIGHAREPLGALRRALGGSTLFEVSPHWLIERLTAVAYWERFDKRSNDWKRVNCPRQIADTLLAREGHWRFPQLTGFLECPTLTLEGRVISKPGYDPQSGLFLSSAMDIGRIDVVSARQAQEAADRLAGIVSEFPFVTEGDRAGVLAMMITSVLRRVLPTAPFGAISASTPATGKSLLADVISIIATGRRASAMSLGNEQAELEKRVDAALLDGDPLIVIDNVDRAVRSDVLCQVATQTSKTVRVLGYSRKVESPTNICWIMTGNNLTVLGDLARRVLMIRLEANTERPEERSFDRDAIAYAHEMRVQAVRDCLLIVKGYIEAGFPGVGTTPYGSFETWDRMVRRAIVWAGFPDPLMRTRELREEDHEFVAVQALMQELHALGNVEGMTAAKIIEAGRDTYQLQGGEFEKVNPGLAEALTMLLGDGPRANASALGYKLRHWQGRLIGNLRIIKNKHLTRSGVVLWAVRQV